jgi:hypothetical protein
MIDSTPLWVLGGFRTEQRKDAGSVHTWPYGRDRGRRDATVRKPQPHHNPYPHQQPDVQARGGVESLI